MEFLELPEIQREVKELETGSETLEVDEKVKPELVSDWQVKQRDASAASRKLRNSSTGDLRPILPVRVRSGGYREKNGNTYEGAGVGNTYYMCCCT